MSDENKAGDDQSSTSVSIEQFNKADERAKRFEAQLTDMQKTLERYKKLGDPDDLSGKLEDYTLLRKKAAEGDPSKIDELIAKEKAELEKSFSGKLTDYEKQNTALKGELKKLRVVNPAIQAAAEVLNPDAIELFKSTFEQALDIDDESNIFVKGEDGKPRRSPSDPRQQMSLREFISELADKHPSCAKAQGKPGVKPGAERNSSVGTNGLTVEKWLGMTPADRQKLGNDTNQAMARQVFKIQSRTSQTATK